MLAVAPRNLLDHHSTVSAINAPHAVQQENQNSPEGDEFKAALREMITAGRRLMATRAQRCGTNPRPNADFDDFLVGAKTVVVIDESPKTMTLVQES